MPHARTTRSAASHPAWWQQRGMARLLLFKADHPRSIDRYIDYFGAGLGTARAAIDPCGEGLLDTFDEAG